VNPEKTCLIRVFDDYFATEEAQPAAPQQTATDMGGSTPPVTDVQKYLPPHARFAKDRLNKASVDNKLQQAQRYTIYLW
jgi:hypothetical protein